MTDISLSFAMDDTPKSSGLISGNVRAEGIVLQRSTEHRGAALFRHQLRTREFDVCDMSMATVFMMADREDDSFVALPVITMRNFSHVVALVREDAGVDDPTQLQGKRIGIPGYQSAAALWCRAAFQHEYGVAPTDVSWFSPQTLDPKPGDVPFIFPEGIDLTTVGAELSLEDMLFDGSIDAIVNLGRPNPALLAPGSGVRPLFWDQRAESIRYFRKTGMYPAHHCIVIKSEVVEEHPWIVSSLYNAFVASYDLAIETLSKTLVPYLETGLVADEITAIAKSNLCSYGLENEHLVLESFSGYCWEQGYTSRRFSPREVFARVPAQ